METKEVKARINTVGITFWYRGHFNRDCEPFSYLWMALAGDSLNNVVSKSKTGKYIIPNEHENELLDDAYHSQKISHAKYMNSLLSVPSGEEHIKQQSTSITFPISAEMPLWKASLLVYQFVNKFDVLEPTSPSTSTSVSSNSSFLPVQRPTEQRIDEMIIPLSDLLLALSDRSKSDDKKPFGWLSKMGKFSFILFPQSCFVSINDSKVCIKHSLVDIARQISVSSSGSGSGKEKNENKKQCDEIMKWIIQKDQARYQLHTASADDNECFYKQGPEYKWLSKHVRFCNMSYIALPCVTSRVLINSSSSSSSLAKNKSDDMVPRTLLPGWAYLQPEFDGSVPYRDQHIQFCIHQAQLALDRMAIKIDNLVSSGTSPINVNLLMEYLVEIICWPARMAIYMRDLFDNCEPDADENVKSKSKSVDLKLTESTSWKTSKVKKHKNKLIDQFALPWSGMFPEKFADDCETLILACYVVYKALTQVVLNDRAAYHLPRELGILKPIMSQYTFVMAAVSIYSGMASDAADSDATTTTIKSESESKVPIESAHDDESPDKHNTIFDPNVDRDSSITCHEVGLFIPTVRLNNWIERYYKYQSLGNHMPSRSEMPVIKCNLPNLVIDPTEYTYGDQSIATFSVESKTSSRPELTRLYIREQDWNLVHASFNKWALEHDIDYSVVDKNPIPVFEHLRHYIICIFDSESKKEETEKKKKTIKKNGNEPKIMKFLQLLYKTYAYPTLFIFKTPRAVSKNWSSYYHLVDGIFTPQTNDESKQLSRPDVWHVIFYNMKTHRRAMPFASVMSNEFEHDMADSILACMPVGPKVSDIRENVELILEDEPSVNLPRI